MPIPHLLHPVPCTIERLNKGATVYDPEAREPIQNAARLAPVTCPGQVKWTSLQDMNVGLAGVEEQARGYVLFRKVDLDALDFMIQINDRITSQGYLQSEVYVTRIEPIAHYPDQGGATMFKAWFADRYPAKER